MINVKNNKNNLLLIYGFKLIQLFSSIEERSLIEIKKIII